MLRIILFVLLFIGCEQSEMAVSYKAEPAKPVRFLALGDSYTIGESVATNNRWPLQLANQLKASSVQVDTLQIIATTGWTTRDLLNGISAANPPENFNLVSLLIGVNNQYQGKNFHQYLSEFPLLLNQAIRLAGGDTSAVFVVSIPDYAYTPFGGGNAGISSEIDQYNAAAQEMCGQYGIPFIDITPISREGLQRPELVARDGLHPSGIQYREWVELIRAKLF
ncbi:MAG: SGNH/GDSL hydrolase family protein [Bacteroidia bacterium]|nr:SGNH/GDSL hydrolase family protein [Bacteroidia bacterium]